jgi:hypothetical protein
MLAKVKKLKQKNNNSKCKQHECKKLEYFHEREAKSVVEQKKLNRD